MLTVQSLFTEYGAPNGASVKAAQDVSFFVPEGKFFTLLGPSGCGKTTTLRSIAGLEKPTSGEISVSGQVVYSSQKNISLPANLRNFGMVFQSYAIWPHMNVFQNVSFPLEVKRLKPSSHVMKEKVMSVLEAVGLDHLAGREATKLSGGQQQRLALARALVMEPRLLLLDEPLSNLDAKLREKMRFELKRMQSKFGITTIYVTHDQSEALALSDEIAVMSEGRIVQIGSPRDIYERPKTKFVADFIGTTNFIEGAIIGQEKIKNLWSVQTPLGILSVLSELDLKIGSKISISIRPEDIYLSDEPLPPGNANTMTGVIEQSVFLGEYMDLKIKFGDYEILARSHPTLSNSNGGRIHVRLDAAKCVALTESS
jgi:iron(III) transport system ATP-binding protein